MLKIVKKYFCFNGFSSNFLRIEMIMKFLRLLLIFLVGVLSISVAYRETIFNSLSMLPGDRYDMVIMSTILEHWNNFWAGNSSWYDVGYFYPYDRTIAQTDGYFLIGVLFSFVRFFVGDVFISVFLTMVIMSGIGFFSFFYLVRKIFLFKIETSLLISSAFVLLSSIVSHSQRLQLMSVYFLPALTSLLILYLSAVKRRNRDLSTTLIGCLFGMLYGAMTVTCFYVSWFYALFLMVLFVIFLLFRPKLSIDWVKSFINLKYSSLIVFLVFILSIVPFVWAYYPKSLEVGVRNYSSVFNQLIIPLELIQVGFDNYLYGGLLIKIFHLFYPDYKQWGEYYNVGFSPLIFGLFIAAIFFFKKNAKELNGYFLLVGVATLICSLLVVKFDGFSLWYYVYSFIPGAKALNAISVFLMVLAFPVLVVVGKYIDQQKFHKTFFVVLATIIIVGELTNPYINFNRSVENSRVADIPIPPSTCGVFYVSALNGQMNAPGFPVWVNSMYAHNVTAMFVSQLIKLPTVNGVASFNPPDWNFAAPWDDGYDLRVLNYAKKHHVKKLCKLDLNNKSWLETKNLPWDNLGKQ